MNNIVKLIPKIFTQYRGKENLIKKYVSHWLKITSMQNVQEALDYTYLLNRQAPIDTPLRAANDRVHEDIRLDNYHHQKMIAYLHPEDLPFGIDKNGHVYDGFMQGQSKTKE